MQVESLEVSRRPSYDSDFPNMLVGMVTMKSTNGSQSVRLSNEGLSRIFGVIAAEVQETARRNAADVKAALGNATNEALLLSSQTVAEVEVL